MLIVDAEVSGRAGMRVRVGETVEAVSAQLRPRPGEEVFDAAGGAVIPGLHDHHVHLRAQRAAHGSVRLDEPGRDDGPESARELIRAADAAAGAGRWLRVIGYDQARMGVLDRHSLDRLVGARPVRVQSATGELWILNSAALQLARVDQLAHPGVERDADGEPTGRLWRLDRWLGDALGPVEGPDRDWRALSDVASARGITGFTDATAERSQDDIDGFARLVERGAIDQRIVLMSPVQRYAPAGIALGPHKIVLDDVSLPEPGELAAVMARAHGAGTPVAVHCVTLDQLVVALAALELAGNHPGDRIEHASVVAPVLLERLRDLAVTVVTQPGFVRDRGDRYLREVDPAERPWLYPCQSLRRAGIAVAAGTDAPHGPSDPWLAIAAAIDRRSANGVVVGATERVDPIVALGLFLGHPDDPGRARRVEPGQPGDLCLLRPPLREVLSDPDADAVAGTVVAGRLLRPT